MWRFTIFNEMICKNHQIQISDNRFYTVEEPAGSSAVFLFVPLFVGTLLMSAIAAFTFYMAKPPHTDLTAI